MPRHDLDDMMKTGGQGGVHWKDRLPFMNLDSDFSVDELREIAIEAPMGMLTDRQMRKLVRNF
jgi:hypothetical protein